VISLVRHDNTARSRPVRSPATWSRPGHVPDLVAASQPDRVVRARRRRDSAPPLAGSDALPTGMPPVPGTGAQVFAGTGGSLAARVRGPTSCTGMRDMLVETTFVATSHGCGGAPRSRPAR